MVHALCVYVLDLYSFYTSRASWKKEIKELWSFVYCECLRTTHFLFFLHFNLLKLSRYRNHRKKWVSHDVNIKNSFTSEENSDLMSVFFMNFICTFEHWRYYMSQSPRSAPFREKLFYSRRIVNQEKRLSTTSFKVFAAYIKTNRAWKSAKL